jgi:hypothetical protein
MLHAVNLLIMVCMVEPMLWILTIFSYLRFSPAVHSRSFVLYMATQLAVSAVSLPVVLMLLTSAASQRAGILAVWTPILWLGAAVSGAFSIAALRDILKRLLSSLPALQRIALITFQWILVAAVFIILSRVVGKIGRASLTGELATLAEGINLTQLVLLLPLLPFTFSVQRTLRSHIQDMMMGLAVLSASESILSLVYHVNGEISSVAAVLAGHIIVIATLAFWCRCFVAQERREVPLTISIDSKLVRLSEKLRVLDPASTDRS